jgi:hypothetical protein
MDPFSIGLTVLSIVFNDIYYGSADDAEAAHYRRPPRYAPGGALASP